MPDTYQPHDYCTQPRRIGEDCATCSLVNYGHDCMNNPIIRPPEEDDDTGDEQATSA